MVLEKPEGMVTFANKRAIELFGVEPLRFEIELSMLRLSKFTWLDGKFARPNNFTLTGRLFNEETILNAPEIIESRMGNALS